jgi:hypothetical protein
MHVRCDYADGVDGGAYTTSDGSLANMLSKQKLFLPSTMAKVIQGISNPETRPYLFSAPVNKKEHAIKFDYVIVGGIPLA